MLLLGPQLCPIPPPLPGQAGPGGQQNTQTHFREGVTSAAAARGISMLVAAAAVRPAVNCRETGLLSFWALQDTQTPAAAAVGLWVTQSPFAEWPLAASSQSLQVPHCRPAAPWLGWTALRASALEASAIAPRWLESR